MKYTKKLLPLLLATLATPTLHAQSFDFENIEEGALIVIGGEEEPYLTEGSKRLAGSVDAVTRDELDYENPKDTLELFSKVPGVTLSRYNQGIINTDVSIRGFAGDGVTPHAKLLIDGIPSNLHNGFNELDQLFSLGIAGIETFKGTSDARYGLYNLAGNYNVGTRTDIAREIQVAYNSFNNIETQAYWGLETGDLTHNYFIGYRDGEGFRENADLQKYTFSGRWFYDFDDTTSLGLIARTNTYEGDSPGYFDDAAEARANPSGSADFSSLDGGEKTTNHLSLHFDKEFYDGVKFSTKAYYQTFERERFVRFLSRFNLQNRFDDQTISGVKATLDWQINDNWVINSGIDYEYQDVLEQRSSTLNNDTRELNALTRDREYDLGVLGGFVSVENTPNDYIRWNAGLRVDSLEGDFVDRLAVSEGSVHDDFDVILQPKVNLFITPTDELTIFANYGRTFQSPFGAALFDRGGEPRDVAINDGVEVGVKYEVEELSTRLSFWYQESDDEFANLDGGLIDVGATERYGIELALGWNPTDRTNIWGNYSHNFHEITDSETVAAIGNELRSIPDYVFSIGGSYQVTDSLTARLHLDGQGDYFVNELNEGGQFGDYVILNAGVDYQTDFGRISLQLNNIFDTFYEYVFDFGNNGSDLIHSPGDGINATVAYTLTF